MNAPVRLLGALAALLLAPSVAHAGPSLLERDGVRAFIDAFAEREGFNAAELRGLFEGLERRDAVLEAIARPAEALPWHKYRPIFLTEERIEAGAAFMADNAALLERARAEYGVPPAVITAILGVETFYGRHEGTHPVLETLATLAFAYPPRADFFRSELEHFLMLAREETIDPTAVKGSYAGAMGMPQFIASSYRSYAVDFDGDGQRQLWASKADVVGSVAAYLARHGWERGAPVAERVDPERPGYRRLVQRGMKPRVTPNDLEAAGLSVEPSLDPDERVSVFEFAGAEGPEVWVGRRNFYVITRYNHSPLYALAVHQLAQRIRAAAQEGAA